MFSFQRSSSSWLSIATVLALGVTIAVSGCSSPQSISSKAAESSCHDDPKTLMNQFADAFNRYDAAALGALFTADARFTNIYGTVMKNRTGIEEGHARAFSSRLSSAELVLRDVKEQSVSDTVTTLYATWELTQPSNGDQTKLVPSGSGTLTTVAQCTASGKWLLAAGSNVRQTAPPS